MITLRSVQPAEAEVLSELAMRSKAHWGYDAAFMAACRAELTVTAEAISRWPTVVAEDEGTLVGFMLLERPNPPLAEIAYLFVAPQAIGRGIGRALFAAAVELARAYGDTTIGIQSDPHAEAFYRRCGAKTVRLVPSDSIPGRMLPWMELAIN